MKRKRKVNPPVGSENKRRNREEEKKKPEV